MKTLILSAITSLISIVSFAQVANPVTWSKSVKKFANKTYEIHVTAKIGKGYRLYAQNPGEGPLPTSIKITKNTIATVNPTIKELGKVIKAYDESFRSVVRYYMNSATFIITVKAQSSTTITGRIEFMTSSDHESLPPKAENFSVKLN